MLMDENVLISVSDEHMKEKNYDPGVIVVANEIGYIDEEKRRHFTRAELIAQMKKVLKLTKYKCGIILDVFIDAGIISEDGDKNKLYLNPIRNHFLKILMTTAKYCLEHLSTNEFKIYCYLFNKYNMHLYYRHVENYYFSEKEVAEAIGYKGRNPQTVRMIKESLLTLRELGLIDYNIESVGRPGKHGTYHELYAVYDYSPVQVEAVQQTVDEFPLLEDVEILQDAAALGAVLNDEQEKYLEEVNKAKELGNSSDLWRLT